MRAGEEIDIEAGGKTPMERTALHFGHYNFVRNHSTIDRNHAGHGCGVSERSMTLLELVD